MSFLTDMFRSIGMAIVELVYELVASLYNLFMYITQVKLFTGENANVVGDIYERIQVILAVVMVFYVTLEFVKYIVNPDTFSDKEKGGGGLLKRILIVIVLMAFTPKIFGIAYDLQGRIITSNVIPKVIINGYDIDFGDNAGGAFSSNLLDVFYEERKYNNQSLMCKGNKVCECDDIDMTAAEAVDNNLLQLKQTGKMTGSLCITDKTNTDNGSLKKNTYLIKLGILDWLLMVAVAGFVCWMLFNYCLEAARVVIQFAFLQIIAPIPIISYIAPGKDGMFNKWVKQCTTTYLDMFIRLFIMYFVMLVVDILLKFFANYNGVQFFGDTQASESTKIFIIFFLIIGALLFGMKAPKMIKELLPGGGNAAAGDFGIGGKASKERFKPLAKPIGAGLGVARGVGKTAAGAWRQHRINKANGQTLGKKLRRNVYDPWGKKGERLFNSTRERWNDRKAISAQKKESDAAEKSVSAAERDLDRARRSGRELAVQTAREATKRLGEGHKKVQGLERQRADLLNGRDVSKLDATERQQLRDIDGKLATARTEYGSLLTTAQQANKQSLQFKQNSPAWQRFTNAQQELKLAQQSGDAAQIKQAQDKLKRAARNVENGDKLQAFFDARNEYDAIMKNPNATPEEQAAAKAKMDGTLKDVGSSAKMSYDERIQAAKNDYIVEAQTLERMEQQYTDKVIKESHDTWRAPVSAASIVGGVASVVSEAYKGSKTKEITDVWKDHVKAQEKIVQKLDQKQAEYDAGGPVGLGATLERTVSQVSKHMGFGTPYERIQSEIKPIESQIKQEKAASTVVESISTSLSDTKKTVEGARGKHKLQNDVSALNNKAVDGGIIEVQTGETADSVLSRYAGVVEDAKKARDVGNERKSKAEMALNEGKARVQNIQTQLGTETDQTKKNQLNADLVREQSSLKSLQDEFDNAKVAADENTKKYDMAERLYGNVEKEITDLTMEQAIRATARGESVDSVGIKEEAVGNDAMQLIANLNKAKTEPNVVNKLRKELSTYLFGEFMKTDYSDIKISDIKKIDDAIKRIRAAISAENASREEQVRLKQLQAEQEKLIGGNNSSSSGK